MGGLPRLGQPLGQLAFEGLLGHGADDAVDRLPILEDHQSGDGHDLILAGQELVLIGVDLADLEFSRIVPGDLVHDRRHHPARAAPGGPEVDEHHPRILQDLFLEVSLREFDGHRESLLVGYSIVRRRM